MPAGLGMWLGTPNPPKQNCPFLCISFTDTQIAGMVVMTLGWSILPAIGIPLWVNGAKPARHDDRAGLASWTFAPLTLPPLRGASGGAPAPPSGVAVVGTF